MKSSGSGAALAAFVGGILALRAAARLQAATALVMILAIPGVVAGLFFLAIIVGRSDGIEGALGVAPPVALACIPSLRCCTSSSRAGGDGSTSLISCPET